MILHRLLPSRARLNRAPEHIIHIVDVQHDAGAGSAQ
jgi:hypothetical protein